MEVMRYFEEDLPFYKGNLHAHTTLSDGRKGPEEVIQIFKDHGYDFLALTDHRKWFPGYEDEQILVIPATEFDRNFISEAPEHAYHITGVGLTKPIPQDNSMSPQEIVDAIQKDGAFCTLAHPAWSLMTAKECLDLKGYDAIEIYNTISEIYSGRGFSDLYADLMASRGRYPLLTAVDDCHYYDRDHCKGYVMVQAKARTREDILASLKQGRFYATQGPFIFQITRHDDRVEVTTSPAVKITFMTNKLYDGHRTSYAPEGETITSASYTMNGSDRYVRIEVRDEEGKTAWSNFIIR